MTIDFDLIAREEAHRKRIVLVCFCVVFLAVISGIFGLFNSSNKSSILPETSTTLTNENDEREVVAGELLNELDLNQDFSSTRVKTVSNIKSVIPDTPLSGESREVEAAIMYSELQRK